MARPNEDLDPNDFPRPLPYRRRVGARRQEQLRPADGRRLGSSRATATRSCAARYGMYYGHIRLLGTLPEFNNFKTFTMTINNPSYPDPFHGQRPARTSSCRRRRRTSRSWPTTWSSRWRTRPAAACRSGCSDAFALHVDARLQQHQRGLQDAGHQRAQSPVTGLRPDPDVRANRSGAAGRRSCEYTALYTKLEKRYQPELPVHWCRTRSPTPTTTRRWRGSSIRSIYTRRLGPVERRAPACHRRQRIGPAAVGHQRRRAVVVPHRSCPGQRRRRPRSQRRRVHVRSGAGHDQELRQPRAQPRRGECLPGAHQPGGDRRQTRSTARASTSSTCASASAFRFGGDRRIELIAPGVQPVQHAEPAGAVRRRPRDQRAVERRSAASPARGRTVRSSWRSG